MELVKVKNKYQIVIPEIIRKGAKVEIGDFLEVKVVPGGIKLEPKTILDREIANGLLEVKSKKTIGPFKDTKAMFRHLDSKK